MSIRILSALTVLILGSTTSFAATPKRVVDSHAELKAKQEALAPEISLQDLRALVENKNKKPMAIIDANGEKSYLEGHIPGALHFAKIETNLSAALPTDKGALVVAYCGSPMCTAWEDAATKVKALGYTNVKHLKAGIKGWKDAKYPTQG